MRLADADVSACGASEGCWEEPHDLESVAVVPEEADVDGGANRQQDDDVQDVEAHVPYILHRVIGEVAEAVHLHHDPQPALRVPTGKAEWPTGTEVGPMLETRTGRHPQHAASGQSHRQLHCFGSGHSPAFLLVHQRDEHERQQLLDQPREEDRPEQRREVQGQLGACRTAPCVCTSMLVDAQQAQALAMRSKLSAKACIATMARPASSGGVPGLGISVRPSSVKLYCGPSDQDRNALVAMLRPCPSKDDRDQKQHADDETSRPLPTQGVRQPTLLRRVAYGGPFELLTALVLL